MQEKPGGSRSLFAQEPERSLVLNVRTRVQDLAVRAFELREIVAERFGRPKYPAYPVISFSVLVCWFRIEDCHHFCSTRFHALAGRCSGVHIDHDQPFIGVRGVANDMDTILPNRLAEITNVTEAFVVVKELCSCLFCRSLAVLAFELQYPPIQTRDLIGGGVGVRRLENSPNLAKRFGLGYEPAYDGECDQYQSQETTSASIL